MRTYKEIKQELEEYKKAKYEEITKQFNINDIIETLDEKFGYKYGRIKGIYFDDEIGEYYLCIKVNKHCEINWISCSHKICIKGEDLKLVRVIENPVLPYLDKLRELQNYLEWKLDEEPLTTKQRNEKRCETEKRIYEIQKMCVHDWKEVYEGGWLDKRRMCYKCEICGLFDEDKE